MTALDDEYAGLFARDEALAARIQAAAVGSGEAVWRMPLHPNYAKTMRLDIADIRNSRVGAGPGAGLGAHFTQFLTRGPTPWAHVDMAGVDSAEETLPTVPKGSGGYGVRSLNEPIRSHER